MFKESAVDLNSAFYPKPAFYSQSAVCILHSVCILPLVRSLQSAVRSLRVTLTDFSSNTSQLAIEVSFAVSLRLRTPFREVIPS